MSRGAGVNLFNLDPFRELLTVKSSKIGCKTNVLHCWAFVRRHPASSVLP